MLLVVSMLVTMVWLAGRYEASQVQTRLERDTADAVSDIRTALTHNLQSLQALPSDNPSHLAWEVEASDLLRNRRELVRIELRDANLRMRTHVQSPYRPVAWDMRLRDSQTDHAFGPGVAELMEHVEATGSLSKGCKCMQMAYSKGWKILKRAEEDLGIPLVQGNRGGSNGGQTVLTPEGKEFLKRYRKFEQEVRAGADASFQKWFGTEEK